MRPILTLFLLFVLTQIMGQEPIEVTIQDRPSSRGIQTAFEVVVPQATTADAIDLWKKTIIERRLFKKSAKMEKVKDEWIVNNIVISDITSLPLNIITQVSSFPGRIYVRTFLQTEGGFIGSSGSSQQTTDAASEYFRNYGVDLYRLAVEKELAEEEKELKELKKDADKLVRKNDTYQEKIEDVVSEKDDLQGDLISVSDELQQKSTEKDINKAERAESRFNRKVKKNEKSQKDKAREIEKQEKKVEEVKTKLGNIR